MKLLLLNLLIPLAFASAPDSALLAACRADAITVKASCLDSPAVPECPALYASYTSCLIALNAPLPVLPSSGDGYSSPYASSPFDICKLEPSLLVVPEFCH